jgi:uncharacterized membrane protein YdjX (TVP38/TMEM64 family)
MATPAYIVLISSLRTVVQWSTLEAVLIVAASPPVPGCRLMVTTGLLFWVLLTIVAGLL